MEGNERAMQSSSTAKLDAALARVIGSIEGVQQTGKVRGDRVKFDYLTLNDLCTAVRSHMAYEGVAVTPNVVNLRQVETKTVRYDKEMISNDWIVDVEFTLRHAGEWIRCTVPGFGQGDAGLYAAYTGAEKYLIRMVFLIGAGDDPEEHQNRKQEPRQEPAKARQTRQQNDGSHVSNVLKPGAKRQQRHDESQNFMPDLQGDPLLMDAPPGFPQPNVAPDPRTTMAARHAKTLCELGAFKEYAAALKAVRRTAQGLANRDGVDATLDHLEEALGVLAEEMNQ